LPILQPHIRLYYLPSEPRFPQQILPLTTVSLEAHTFGFRLETRLRTARVTARSCSRLGWPSRSFTERSSGFSVGF
jgi:hypothetical protein